jgi:hypothetical protein
MDADIVEGRPASAAETNHWRVARVKAYHLPANRCGDGRRPGTLDIMMLICQLGFGLPFEQHTVISMQMLVLLVLVLPAGMDMVNQVDALSISHMAFTSIMVSCTIHT